MTTTPGIDVSRYQGAIDWRQVANAQYRFAVVRATVGASYTDPAFETNWNGAKSNGLLVSAYHVVKPEISGAAQIDGFFTALGGKQSDLPLVLDVELTGNLPPAQITNTIRDCANLTTQHAGRKPIVYTARWFWNPWVLSAPDWSQYDLWVASYGTAQAVLPNGWSAWKIWQYANNGIVPGIPAVTDLNWFSGAYDDLLKYCNQSVTLPSPGQAMKVTADSLNVRNGAGAGYSAIGTLRAGDTINVVNLDGTDLWVQVDQDKWAALSYHGTRFGNVELRPQPDSGLQMRVLSDTLNVRSGPDVTFGVVSTLSSGSVVNILKVDGRDAWGQLATDKWCALAFRGSRFVEFV